MKTVSIIVPIYNVEDYLARCVDSIIIQTYPALEIILVDDGSPDGCGAVCDKYAAQDERIRVIHKKNGGLSDARNAGLDIASGEFVFFVDSDDWIAPDTIEVLMSHMEDSVDIVAGSSVDVAVIDGEVLHKCYSVPLGEKLVMDRRAAMKDNLLGGWAAWNKLYRRNLWTGLRFPVGRINEDEAVLLHVLHCCNCVIQVGHPTYYYFLRQNSITTASFSEKKMDWYENCIDNYRFIRDNYPELLLEAEYRLETCVLYLLQFMLLEHKRFSSQIGRLRDCLRERYSAMMQNPYTTSRDRKRLFILKKIVDLKLEGVYQRTYAFYQKAK